MQSMPTLSDRELLARMPTLVRGERAASAEVIAHLMEIDRRQLYLGEACSSLFAYCRERLGYSEDGALKRMRVARLALVVPAALDELRNGTIHLTGLFVLSRYVTPEMRMSSWAKRAASRGASSSVCWLGFFRDRTWQSGLLRSPGFPQVASLPVPEQAEMNSAAVFRRY